MDVQAGRVASDELAATVCTHVLRGYIHLNERRLVALHLHRDAMTGDSIVGVSLVHEARDWLSRHVLRANLEQVLSRLAHVAESVARVHFD